MSALDSQLQELLLQIEAGDLGAAAQRMASLEEFIASGEAQVTAQTQATTQRVGLALRLALEETKDSLAEVHRSRQTLKAYGVPGGRSARAGRLA